MLLTIDIGNSNTQFGFFDADELAASFRIHTGRRRTSDEIGLLLQQFIGAHKLPPVDSMAFACVVPRLTPVYERISRDLFGIEALRVSHRLKLNVRLDYDNPAEIGADRICNAVAAFDQLGGPTIVVDFGTATNFDVITAAGSYVGGVLAPGIETAHAALAGQAAQLFRVAFSKPESTIGRSTEAALTSGYFLGAVGQTDYIVAMIADELGAADDLTVVATGGLASLIAPESRYISRVLPNLTLEGLRLIHRLNSG
jgi:type III pantothenate kinase